jgi:VanZ family protein
VDQSSQNPSPLARYLFIAYVLLVVYATLYPFGGWRDAGISAFAYLTAARPRYITGFDLTANVLGYVPYGLLAVLAMYPRVTGVGAFFAALLSGAALALTLEAVQTFLPTRIASNVDVGCNVVGAGVGALMGLGIVRWLFGTSLLLHLRTQYVAPGARADAGLVLIGLWLATQLDPAGLLFGAGDLRDLFRQPRGSAYEPDVFVTIEALTAACNLVAVGLIASTILKPSGPVLRVMLGLIALGLVVKTGAFVILRQAEDVFHWLTPGALIGLAAGVPVLLATAMMPRALRIALATVLLMGATVLVNLAPPNPYFASTLAVWAQGHFLNFNGLTRLLSLLWPFAAVLYLVMLSARHGEERPRG